MLGKKGRRNNRHPSLGVTKDGCGCQSRYSIPSSTACASGLDQSAAIRTARGIKQRRRQRRHWREEIKNSFFVDCSQIFYSLYYYVFCGKPHHAQGFSLSLSAHLDKRHRKTVGNISNDSLSEHFLFTALLSFYGKNIQDAKRRGWMVNRLTVDAGDTWGSLFSRRVDMQLTELVLRHAETYRSCVYSIRKEEKSFLLIFFFPWKNKFNHLKVYTGGMPPNKIPRRIVQVGHTMPSRVFIYQRR